MPNPYDDRYDRPGYYWGKVPSQTCYRVLQILPPDRPLTLLDIGCGEGRNAVFFARNGYHVMAFDTSPKGVEKTRHSQTAAGAPIDAFVARHQRLPPHPPVRRVVFNRRPSVRPAGPTQGPPCPLPELHHPRRPQRLLGVCEKAVHLPSPRRREDRPHLDLRRAPDPLPRLEDRVLCRRDLRLHVQRPPSPACNQQDHRQKRSNPATGCRRRLTARLTRSVLQ